MSIPEVHPPSPEVGATAQDTSPVAPTRSTRNIKPPDQFGEWTYHSQQAQWLQGNEMSKTTTFGILPMWNENGGAYWIQLLSIVPDRCGEFEFVVAKLNMVQLKEALSGFNDSLVYIRIPIPSKDAANFFTCRGKLCKITIRSVFTIQTRRDLEPVLGQGLDYRLINVQGDSFYVKTNTLRLHALTEQLEKTVAEKENLLKENLNLKEKFAFVTKEKFVEKLNTSSTLSISKENNEQNKPECKLSSRKPFENYTFTSVKGIDKKDEKIQTATFLHVIGTDALEVFNTFKFDNEGDQEKMEPVTDKFQQYCNPRKNVTFERHVFFTRNQQAVETIGQYVTELRTRATTCEFGDLCDSLIKDRLVCGVRDETIRARLLRDSDLNLKKAIDICRASEMSASQLKSLTSEDDKLVHVVKQKQTRGGMSKSAQTGKSQYENPDRKGKVQVIDTHDDTEDLFIGTVQVDKVSTESVTNNDEWFVNLRLKNKSVKFKIDTGAQCNVISKKDYIAAGGKTVSRKNVKKLYTLTGERIQTVGRAMVQCEYKNRYYVLDCHVVEQDVTPVIGLLSCQELNLVKKVDAVSTETKQNTDILKEYSDVFSGLQGSFYKHHIEIDPTVKPVVHPPRKVPLAVHDQVKQELDRMEKLGVVEKVHEPTGWVNSMVVVKKSNNKLRICIDPKDLNKAIKREHFPMKTIDDVTAKVANAKYFSKFDAESGFWQIVLDEPSSNLCTFNTPFGRYKFLRVPFGISSAPEVFQRAMSEVFKDLDGVETIVNDILIWGETREQHDARLRSALETARKANVKLNKSKCQIAATELNYIGHTLSAQGLKSDAEKVKAIQEMPDPEDKAGLMRFMGMVQYVAKFIPNLAEVSAPLRQLLENDVCWDWGQSQQNSYKRLKDLVSEAPVLKFYDVKQPVTLSVDASSTGLGAVLLQNNQPVAYASKSLTTAQNIMLK
ncbi:uncharacterized protein LOC132563689 [Ylistrum balloti]|uniref:uncharacterized protein LOC132562724 n=1 Tax=Ylistrum balloti TaxID=509963 RepID=UPI002905BFE3|nr:uncharacterized protein LOC132562724 [Ylistrum balloti]XP_060084423.1 uncharacterized protein LOC132563689 [Ylistrum balloti]